MAEAYLKLAGLTTFEKLELGETEGLTYEPARLSAGDHGEPGTFTVLITLAAIQTLGMWLLKRHNGQSFEEVVEIVHPDGRTERRHIKWSAQSEEAPSDAVIRQIKAPIQT